MVSPKRVHPALWCSFNPPSWLRICRIVTRVYLTTQTTGLTAVLSPISATMIFKRPRDKLLYNLAAIK